MAAVMITKELLNSVDARINAIGSAEVKENCPDLEKAYTEDVSELFNQASWGSSLHVMNQLPTDWLVKAERPAIFVRVSRDDGAAWKVGVNFQGLQTAYYRPSKDRWMIPEPEVSLEWVQAHQHLHGASILLQRVEDTKTAAAIRTRFGGIRDQVIDFLKSCRSLNEAVKLMPDIKHYLHPDYLDRLDRKAERKTAAQQRAEELLSKMDVDAIAAVAIAAKLQEVK